MAKDYMSRIRGPYVRFCERDEAVTPHPTRYYCHIFLNNFAFYGKVHNSVELIKPK